MLGSPRTRAADSLPRYPLCRSEECLGAVWFCTSASPRVALNVPEELELNVVVAGNAVLQVGSELYPVSAGDVLWIAPAQPRVTRACSPDLAMWALMFRPRFLEELGKLQSLALGAPAQRCTLAQRELDELSVSAYRLLRNQKQVRQFNLSLAALFLETWRKARGHAGAVPPQHPAVATAVHLLHERSERLALPGLARRVGLSPHQLSRLFHRQVGVPLSFYAAHLAVQRFAHLSSQQPASNTLQCALSAGFGSYAQFYRSFSLVVGLGPREHRRLLDVGVIPRARYVPPELPRANPARG